MNQRERDNYFALMVRHCAALKRGDVQTEESTAEELDSIWKAHGNTAEAEWKEACLWIADCVAGWPKDSSQPAPVDVRKLDPEIDMLTPEEMRRSYGRSNHD